MRYMIIVKASTESEASCMPTEERMNEMATYHEELARAGVLLDAAGLQASATGWKVQYRGDKRTVVDGPFTEAKEMIAGYTLIQVKSREEALEWSRRFPNPHGYNRDCEIEVRRLMDLEDFEPNAAIDRFRKMEEDAKRA